MSDSRPPDTDPALHPPAGRVTRPSPARPRFQARPIGDAVFDFARRVFNKAEQDNIFFMAGAIAFNVLVAFIPLILAVLGIAGTILRLQHTDPTQPLIAYLLQAIPPVSTEFELWVRSILGGLIEQSPALLSVSTIILIWVATRLVGTLRSVLREVFDVHQDRGIVAGKLFDIQMVFAAGTLFAINVTLTIVLEVVAVAGGTFLGLLRGGLDTFELLWGRLIAFLFIWVMFLLIYRFLPLRRVRWTTAVIAASFTASLFEILKLGFSWYVTNVAVYTSTYGNLATLVILIFWIYYSSIVFILGGEVAQVAAALRIRKQQKERPS